uniref:TLDc domain-containing protein n=1 Tax=Xiphophorus maculatus TaxID=8083 RepID=A0A3B5PW31_XIPMA
MSREIRTLGHPKLHFIFSNLLHPCASLLRIITAAESKRSLSLYSSVQSELESDEGRPQVRHPRALSHQKLMISPQLASHMPPKTQGYPWQLVYSTSIHGTSLQTLYSSANLDSPVLLVVKDMFTKVFGAFCSDPFSHFGPDFQVEGWGKNSYSVSGSREPLQIGGGGGGFALWLDADLCCGASFSFPTFHNAPLSTHEDFTVLDIEVWTVQGLNGSVKQTRFLL